MHTDGGSEVWSSQCPGMTRAQSVSALISLRDMDSLLVIVEKPTDANRDWYWVRTWTVIGYDRNENNRASRQTVYRRPARKSMHGLHRELDLNRKHIWWDLRRITSLVYWSSQRFTSKLVIRVMETKSAGDSSGRIYRRFNLKVCKA